MSIMSATRLFLEGMPHAFTRVVFDITDDAAFGTFSEAAQRYFPRGTGFLAGERKMAVINRDLQRQKALGALRNRMDNTPVSVDMYVSNGSGVKAAPMSV